MGMHANQRWLWAHLRSDFVTKIRELFFLSNYGVYYGGFEFSLNFWWVYHTSATLGLSHSIKTENFTEAYWINPKDQVKAAFYMFILYTQFPIRNNSVLCRQLSIPLRDQKFSSLDLLYVENFGVSEIAVPHSTHNS